MTKSRWQEIEALFNSSITLSGEKRLTFLKDACGEDLDLLEEVLTLLTEDSKIDNFLENSIEELGFDLLTENGAGMTFLEGHVIGSYKISNFLGNGGMGAVYLAEDTQLKRKVALKILTPIFVSGDDIENFKREAQSASAVNHPCIAHIYEYNFIDGKYFIAMEYIEGKTLRQILKTDDLDPEQIVDIALQICNALSAAHSLGIIHRDIKPENIIVRDDNMVKILDFGLAKLIDETHSGNSTDLDLSSSILRGTPYYMSPELIRGEIFNQRTDLWSLGIVMYEMIALERPFQGKSTAEIFNSILTQKLNGFDKLEKKTSPKLAKVIRRCLSKRPEHRFQTAQDLAFILETYTRLPGERLFDKSKQIKERQFLWFGILSFVALLIVSLIAVSPYIWKPSKAELPEFKQLTFQRGTIWNARFSQDDTSVIYSASWYGNKLDLFTAKTVNSESKKFNIPDANLLAVSSKNEMAILKPTQYIYQFIQQGTLYRMHVNGEAPREIAENVQEADWSPDGESMAISRYLPTGNRLEYPIGKVLFETTGYISSLRISPTNEFVAFLDHPKPRDNRGYVSIVDNNGNKRTLTEEFSGIEGLAWQPKSGEIWFTASKKGEAYAIYATTITGETRLISRMPTNLTLYDISNTGQVLLSRSIQLTDILGANTIDKKEQNLSWRYLIGISDLSKDGKVFLFTYFGEGSGSNYSIYLRATDGSPAVQLGQGRGLSLSPDSKFVLAKLNVPTDQLNIIPIKSGEPQKLPQGNIEKHDKGNWFPDGENILFTGNARGEGNRTFKQNISSGEIKPLTPIGFTGTLISSDGKMIIVKDPEGRKLVFKIETGEMESIRGVENDEVINWSSDNKSIFVYNPLDFPISAYKLAIDSGKKELLLTTDSSNPIGRFGSQYLFITPDAKYYIYGIRRYFFDLYSVDNLS